ncbi:MAG: DUF1800 domain-containing protein [Fimbriiglobus sp.]
MPNPWAIYTPSPEQPWNAKRAAHLLRRATFAVTKTALDAALQAGPEATITSLLKGQPAVPEQEAASQYMASERALPKGSSGTQLAAWWLARMMQSRHPLREKLSLFWHNHFATSITKVQNARYMLGQYRLIHEHALGDFRKLLQAMSVDPAMMVWLDTIDSKKGKPNENYARELMELFSLGIGNYSEADIREAARAFTGYEIKNGQSTHNPSQHDATPKKVFGQTGKYQAQDIVRLCLENPACAEFIARKMIRDLVSDIEEPASDIVTSLAKVYRDSGYNTAKLVETILRSEYFFRAEHYRAKVKSPVEFALSIILPLQGNVGALPLATALEPLGQQLFAPPSVKGWDGGPTWLNAQTLLFRQNLALALTSTTDNTFGSRCDPLRVLNTDTPDAENLSQLVDLFYQGDIPAASRESLEIYLKQKTKRPRTWSESDEREQRLRTLTHLVLTLPEFQLS